MFSRSMKCVSSIPCFQKLLVSTHPHCIILSVISNLFESIINKIVDRLNRNNLLGNKQYAFHYSSSTADILSLHAESMVSCKKIFHTGNLSDLIIQSDGNCKNTELHLVFPNIYATKILMMIHRSILTDDLISSYTKS